MIFDVALGIFLFLSPTIIMLGKNAIINGKIMALQYYQFKTLSFDSNVLQYQFFQYGVLVLFMVALSQKSIRDFKDKYIAWFLGLCGISVLLHPKTLPAFTPILLGVLLYYLVIKYAKNVKRLLYVVVLISALNTLFSIFQFFNIHWLYKPTGRIDGLMSISSHLGVYQALSLPICYAIHPALSIIPLVGLILSKSTTAILASIIGVCYLVFPKRKKVYISPMGIIMLFGIFGALIVRNYNYILYKIGLKSGLWIATLKQSLKNPMGYGLGTFSELSDKFYSYKGHWDWAYNEYLGIAFCIGILAWLIVGLFLIDNFKGIGAGLERAVAASCLTIAVICMGQSPLHFPRLAGTIIPMFAFLAILKRRESCV